MLLPFITTWILALAHSLLCFIPAYGQRLTSFGTIALAFVQALFLGGIGYQQLAGVTYFQSSIYRLPFSVVPGQPLAFFIDAPGLAFALLVSVLWLVTTIYMAGYCAQHQLARRARFYCWMQVSVMLALLAAFAANLVTLFIIYELLTLTTALLVLHKGSDKALKAGRFYLRLLLGSSLALLLPAVIWLTHNYGSGWHYLLHDHPNLAGLQLSLLVLLIVYGTSKTAMWHPLARRQHHNPNCQLHYYICRHHGLAPTAFEANPRILNHRPTGILCSNPKLCRDHISVADGSHLYAVPRHRQDQHVLCCGDGERA